eukprot:6272109-Pyramimonas_sp.AAC.1
MPGASPTAPQEQGAGKKRVAQRAMQTNAKLKMHEILGHVAARWTIQREWLDHFGCCVAATSDGASVAGARSRRMALFVFPCTENLGAPETLIRDRE